MKRIIVIIILAVGFLSSAFAQTDRRARETKIADIVMLLPANDTETFNRLMGELLQLGEVIDDLAPRLADQGGNDLQLRYAISGLSMYASNDAAGKPTVSKSLCNAIANAKSDEIRDFLFIQLQYVAGDESVETAGQYLTNDRLADAAARVLVRIGTDAAGKALLTGLDKTSGAQLITCVKALGDMRYQPAANALNSLITTGDMNLRRVVLHSLAQIASPSSEKILSQSAKTAKYKYEPTDALGSYLLYLRNNIPAQAGMVTKAAKNILRVTTETTPPTVYVMIIPGILTPIESKAYSYKQLAARNVALELLTLTAGEAAIKELLQAIKSGDKQYREAALKYSKNIPSTKMADDLLTAAKKERRPDVKAEIIAAFGERGDEAAWPFVQECLSDNAGAVRSAAIEAAGRLAGAEAVAGIVQAMNTNDEQVVSAGKNTLSAIAGNQVITEIVAALPQASAPAQVAFLDILSLRQAASQLEAIFAQTSSTDAAVRLAAMKALATTVTEKDASRVAQLLNTASNKDESAALQQALFAALSAAQNQDIQTDRVMEQAMKSRNPGVYANVLAMIGGKKALEIVMSQGFNSGNANLKEAAFDALLNWSDSLAIPQLYKLAANNPSGTYFDKALTAYISKTGASKHTPEQKLIMLRDALTIAQTPAQKQSSLQQIARTGTFLGLMTAGRYLDDNNVEVQQAAVQAVRTIALAHPAYYGPEITVLLNKAMAVNKDPEADYQKQAIQKHLAGLPQDGGFVSMFNGRDLTGWKGLVENPIARAKMTPKELTQKQAKADEIMRNDWKVVDGLLVYEGKGYDNLCSEKDYADFEMYVDWKITAKGDAGIYLRGSPQVQIWDIANRSAAVGSGGLYNNQRHPRNPLVVADNPVDEWNSFYIKMIGEKVTVFLNGQLVVDNITLENYWDRTLPIFEKDAIELQAHGDRVEYRDLYVREIPRPEPYKVSDAEKAEGFKPMFNGIDMSGWVGNLRDYIPLDGSIVCDPAGGGNGNLYTDKDYSDFVMRFEFMLTPAANNGIAIRAPFKEDASYAGIELQVLDNEAEVYRDIQPYQFHGSVYGVIPAKRGYLKPTGEWNVQEIIVEGYHVKITLNGTVILDDDMAKASKNFTETMDKRRHPELSAKSGRIGFLGHGSWVAFRHLRIKEID